MSLRIAIKHPDLNKEEFTTLTSDIAASGTALTVASNDDFAANDIACVGNPGEELTELKTVSSVATAVTINTSAVSFAHPAGTPIYRALYNQISLERATSSGGTYNEIAEGKINIDIDSDDGFTIISVAAGATTDYFKWRFYNTASGTFSAYSDAFPGTGLGASSVAMMLSEVRHDARIPDHQALPDEQLIAWFNDCQREIAAMYERWWFLLTESTSLIVADDYTYALPTDFDRMESLRYKDASIDYRLKYLTLPEFDQMRIDHQTAPSNDAIGWYAFLPPDSTSPKGYVGIFPVPETASSDIKLTFRYYKQFEDLVTFTDTTPVPIPMALVNYALYRYWRSKGQKEEADNYYADYTRDLERIKRMQKREVGEGSLFRWRGHAGRSKLFGNRISGDPDYIKENYF